MSTEYKFKTYGLQVVVFLSFLALFSLIIAGIVFYGYQSNLEIMLQSSDELLYQISETITRQINSHLEPANKNSIVIKNHRYECTDGHQGRFGRIYHQCRQQQGHEGQLSEKMHPASQISHNEIMAHAYYIEGHSGRILILDIEQSAGIQ